MCERWGAIVGFALFLALPAPGLAGPGGGAVERREDEPPATAAERCEDMDFIGCVTVEFDKEDGLGVRLRSCNGPPGRWVSVFSHFATLDDACQSRCRPALDGLVAALSARAAAEDAFEAMLDTYDERSDQMAQDFLRGDLQALGNAMSVRDFKEEEQRARQLLADAQVSAARAEAAYKACACRCAPRAAG